MHQQMIAAFGQDRAPRNLQAGRPARHAGGDMESKILLPELRPAIALGEIRQALLDRREGAIL